MNKAIWGTAITAFIFTLLSACNAPTGVDLPLTAEPTLETIETPFLLPTPDPQETESLVVCLSKEPESLYRYHPAYLYGDSSRQAETILQAIYDGPIDVLGYAFRPVILEKIPNFNDGDARLVTVELSGGEVYLNPVSLQPENLELGKRYLPAGCDQASCIATYGGGQVSLDQMVVEFKLLPNLTWSDGAPLTARDSVFSFELDSTRATPPPNSYLVDRTRSYEALDDQTARWTGIPGFIDAEYGSNFWSPLPAHVLSDLSPEELLSADEANRFPLGWGPYRIVQWEPGQFVLAERNPNYFRAEEGLPRYSRILFRFVGEDQNATVDQLLSEECDLLDESTIADVLDTDSVDSASLSRLKELEREGKIAVAWVAGNEMERLDFNLTPVETQDVFPLNDLILRMAIAACIDREALVEEILLGMSEVPDTYLPASHPFYQPGEFVAFDPGRGAELLEELGWASDGAGGRNAEGIPGVVDGTPLRFSIKTTPTGVHTELIESIRSDLAACGIQADGEGVPAAELYAPWPEGPVFSRRYEAVAWAWPSWVSPLCEMFSSNEIPSENNPLGINAAGFSSTEYDQACSTMQLSIPERQSFVDSARRTQEIVAQEIPAIPLFMRPRVVAHVRDLCEVAVDPTAFSALWNLESIWRGECAEDE